MTSAMGRAERALRPFYRGATGKGGGYGDCWEGRSEDIARAALLAFLDADEAMVEKVARAMCNDRHSDVPDWHEYVDHARAALAALREVAEAR